ncbi:MAG TPA: Swt1 family HEPN domain-containing protein [Bacilli bacterium]|jgi:hypothetical protein
MIINQSEKTNLYNALAMFQNAFRSYIVETLKNNYGDNWLSKFKDSLSPQKLNNWEINLKNGSDPERSIDFQHFKSFALKNKDLIRNQFGNKTNDLPTWLGEILEVRNKIAHFDEISQDESMKAWIHLRTISRMLGEVELEQKILHLQTNKPPEKALSQLDDPRSKNDLTKNKIHYSDSFPFNTLDIVNCAKAEFREMVLTHNVYLCPAKGGAYNHKQCKYLGVYWEKHVGAVGEIEAVVDVYSETEAQVYFINGDKSAENYIYRAKKKALELRPEERSLRVFLIENLYPTNFSKDSSGGMFGSKIYLNVENLNVKNSKELAAKLDGKRYSEFGLK